jgi:uncharacterized protein YdcH (DUF465 family)
MNNYSLGTGSGPAESIIMNLEILKKKYQIILNQYNQTQNNYFQYLSHYSPGNQITNGNFDNPTLSNDSFTYITSSSQVPGWNFNNGALINNSSTWKYPTPYPNGNQAVSIQYTGSISQSLSLAPGTYNLSFMACGRPCCDGSNLSNPIDVQLNGTTIYNVQPVVNTWTNYSTIFTIGNEGANEGTNEGANQGTATTNTISFLGTWSNSDRSSAIQNISILFNGLKSIPNSSFLGNSPISTNQVDNLSSCVASCSALSNCSGATYNKDQKICTLSSGKGSVVPSTNSGNTAIVSENLYYLNQIKQLNEQLLELNHQIRTSIHQGRPVYNETIQELGKSSTDLKDTYHQLEKERIQVKKMMKEFENLDSEQQESSLMSSSRYSLFIFYLILCIIVVLFLIFMFWTRSSSSTNSSGTNSTSSIFNNEGS